MNAEVDVLADAEMKGRNSENRLRILVYPHELAMGGSQINALELAGAVRDLGHDVYIFATSGVLVDKVKDLGLPYFQAPKHRYTVDPRTIRNLKAIVRDLRIDVIHAYEWTAIVNAAMGPCLTSRTPAVMTVLSMDVPDFLPRHVPLIVGTRGLGEDQAKRRDNVHVLEPPIDTVFNSPGDSGACRAALGIRSDTCLVSVVGRLTSDLDKVDGVLAAINVVYRLSADRDVTLVVAGDGESAGAVRNAASWVNSRRSKKIVHVLGNVLDPRPIYDAADIVLGMGSSALRGMAYAKPLIVQGESGFWQIASPGTDKQFLQHGWFGSNGQGEPDLEKALLHLLDNPSRRFALGRYGRALVQEKFGLGSAANKLLAIYRTQSSSTGRATYDSISLARTAVEVAKFRLVMNSPITRRSVMRAGTEG